MPRKPRDREVQHVVLTEDGASPLELDAILRLWDIAMESNAGFVNADARDKDGHLLHLVSLATIPGPLWVAHVVREQRRPGEARESWIALMPGEDAVRERVATARGTRLDRIRRAHVAVGKAMLLAKQKSPKAERSVAADLGDVTQFLEELHVEEEERTKLGVGTP